MFAGNTLFLSLHPFFNDLIPRARNGRWLHTTYGQLIMCISTELISCHQQCAFFGSDLEGDIIQDELLEGDTQQFICHSSPLVSQWLCSALGSYLCGVCVQCQLCAEICPTYCQLANTWFLCESLEQVRRGVQSSSRGKKIVKSLY